MIPAPVGSGRFADHRVARFPGLPKAALPTTVCPAAVAEITAIPPARERRLHPRREPKTWNGNLVVFAHGGPADAVKGGYAWVASSYRRGLGVQGGRSEHARKFFSERIAKPKRTVLHGASYGGLVGSKLVETYAKAADGSVNFDGALFNSGFVVGAAVGHDFRADLRAVYQYYCKNLPRPDEPQYPLWSGIPAASKMTLKDLEALVDECTGIAKPAAARTELQKQNLANILGVMRFPDRLLVRHMQAATFLFREIGDRTTQGRNAFSNMGVQYKGSTDDVALNRDIARFAADPAAVADLKADGSPTGALPVPVLSIHSINDPQVVVEVQSAYRDVVHAAGNGDRLVQAYTDENEHTGQSGSELAAALDSLMLWIEKGTKPTAQSVATRCEQLLMSYDGPCRYHPEYAPKAYSTRYARGAAEVPVR